MGSKGMTRPTMRRRILRRKSTTGTRMAGSRMEAEVMVDPNEERVVGVRIQQVPRVLLGTGNRGTVVLEEGEERVGELQRGYRV